MPPQAPHSMTISLHFLPAVVHGGRRTARHSTLNTSKRPKGSGTTQRPFSAPSHALLSGRRPCDLLRAHPSETAVCSKRASSPAPTSDPSGCVLCALMKLASPEKWSSRARARAPVCAYSPGHS